MVLTPELRNAVLWARACIFSALRSYGFVEIDIYYFLWQQYVDIWFALFYIEHGQLCGSSFVD